MTVRPTFNLADRRVAVDAVLDGDAVRPGATVARVDKDIKFSIEGLEAYFFAEWNPVLVDLLLVAAAVEFCDRSTRRPKHGWFRSFDVRVAVHDMALWKKPEVTGALIDALGFLTGDVWSFDFLARGRPLDQVRQQHFILKSSATVIMPYSDGLDSRAVATLSEHDHGSGLVRVRLGSGGSKRSRRATQREPFTVVPYSVHLPKDLGRETSARSRGFKFAVVTGVAAQLAGVSRIVVSESGQGSIGPALVTTGHSYPDYRSHPMFLKKVEHLFAVLCGKIIHYEYPRLWCTKGETLAEASRLTPELNLAGTRSCWMGARQVSVNRHRRQCGVCAACLLRRMSMHHAGLQEPSDTYVWADLSASSLREGATEGFKGFTDALDQYATAGVLHLDHLAALADSSLHEGSKRRAVWSIGHALGEDESSVQEKLESLLRRHKDEWLAFLASLSPASFVRRIATARL